MSTSTSSVPARSTRQTTGAPIVGFFGQILIPFATSRSVLLLFALILTWLLDTGRAPRYEYISNAPLAALSATFDANWFGSIATEGYSTSGDVSQQQNYHFFPLYPVTMKLAGDLLGVRGMEGGYQLAGVLLSHLFFFIALGAIYRLTLPAFGSATLASGAVWVAAFSPWSFVFSMSYSESLFLMLSALACLAAFEARLHRDPAKVAAATLFVVLAALTRPQGLVLAIPVALLLAFGGPTRSVRARATLAAVVIVPAALAVGGFILYIALRTGDFLALWKVNSAWGEGWLMQAWNSITYPPAEPLGFASVLSTLGPVIWGALITYQFRLWAPNGRNESAGTREALWAWLAYSTAFYALTLLTNPSNAGWGRYAVVVLPNIWAVAYMANGWSNSLKRAALACSLALQSVFLAAAVLFMGTP